MNYPAHGSHQVRFYGDIIVAELHGSWNEQAAQHYGKEMREHVALLAGRPWCRVVDLSNYELHTPGVISLGKGFARWTAEHGCLFHSYIFSNFLQRQTVQQMFDELGQAYGEASSVIAAIAQCRQVLDTNQPLSVCQ